MFTWPGVSFMGDCVPLYSTSDKAQFLCHLQAGLGLSEFN